jgi:hypothetical protein
MQAINAPRGYGRHQFGLRHDANDHLSMLGVNSDRPYDFTMHDRHRIKQRRALGHGFEMMALAVDD